MVLPSAAQAVDDVPGRAPRGRVEAGRGLVQEDQIGIADERETEVEPPPLPARERGRDRVGRRRQADQASVSSIERGRV